MEKFKKTLLSVIVVLVVASMGTYIYMDNKNEKQVLKDKETKELEVKIFEAGAKLGSEQTMKQIIEMSNTCQIIDISVSTGTSTEPLKSQVVGTECAKKELKKQQDNFNKLIKEIKDSNIQDDNN